MCSHGDIFLFYFHFHFGLFHIFLACFSHIFGACTLSFMLTFIFTRSLPVLVLGDIFPRIFTNKWLTSDFCATSLGFWDGSILVGRAKLFAFTFRLRCLKSLKVAHALPPTPPHLNLCPGQRKMTSRGVCATFRPPPFLFSCLLY